MNMRNHMRDRSFGKLRMTERGFIALTSVLLVSVVALSIAVSVTLLGIDEAQNSLDFKKGLEAFKLAESCAEEGLLRSRNDDSYTGGVLTFSAGECSIQVTDTGSGKIVDVVGSVSGPPEYTRKISVSAEKDGNGVTVVTWEETN